VRVPQVKEKTLNDVLLLSFLVGEHAEAKG
jgi:hypothetical protein